MAAEVVKDFCAQVVDSPNQDGHQAAENEEACNEEVVDVTQDLLLFPELYDVLVVGDSVACFSEHVDQLGVVF